MLAYIDFTESVDILTKQYHELVFNTLDVRNISDPVYMMPLPAPPHYRGDIVISASRDYPTPQEYHYHDYFVVFYAYRGDYVFNIMGEDTVLREGDVTLFQPLVGHSILEQHDPNQILFTIRLRKTLLFQSLLPVMPKNDQLLDFFLSSDEPAYSSIVRSMIEVIVQEYVNMLPGYDSLLDSACTVLFSVLSRFDTIRNTGQKATSVITNILQYISRNCATVTLEQVAERFSYNSNYLSVLLRKETGKTFSEILRSIRLQRVCTLLENSDMSVENIAVLAGYPHNSYFYKTFRNAIGVTPTQYREKLKSVLPE